MKVIRSALASLVFALGAIFIGVPVVVADAPGEPVSFCAGTYGILQTGPSENT